MCNKVTCNQAIACRESMCGGKEPHNFDTQECNHCPKNRDARCISAEQHIKWKRWWEEKTSEPYKYDLLSELGYSPLPLSRASWVSLPWYVQENIKNDVNKTTSNPS